MKKSESPHTPMDHVKAFMQRTFEGAGLGVFVVTGLTPMFNWSNHKIAADPLNPFRFRTSMTGWTAYSSAVGQETAVSYASYNVFVNAMQEGETPLSHAQKISASSCAGAIAGILDTPAELIAQNKQFYGKAISTSEIVKLICAQNGARSLWRGNCMVMLRESAWASVYLSVAPMISQSCQNIGSTKPLADFVAAIATGCVFGMISTPINVLRFEQQKGLTQQKPKESYVSIAIRNGRHGLFRGLLPRTLTTVIAAGAFTKGREKLEEFKKSLNKL